MSRMRPIRQSNTITVRGSSRTMTSTLGMVRDSKNQQLGRASKVSNRFQTPEKIRGNGMSYTTKKQTQFDPKDYMVAECSIRDIQIYKQVFDFLDQDHDGNLTPLDLRKCIRQYGGYNPGRKFVYVAMSVFDSDDGGQIDFRQFIKLMTMKPYQKDTQDDLLRVFQAVDQDGKGFIDETDLLKLAQEMNQKVDIQEVRQAILYACPEGDGRIKLNEFVKFCRRKDFD